MTVERLPGLRERNRLRTRDDILDAAAALLGEFGYNGATLEDVARQAGMSRKTIYSYFPDGRDEMVRAAYLRVASQVEHDGAAARELQVDPAERVMALAEVLIRTAAAPEGRFYGNIGPDVSMVLSPISGSASRSYEALMQQDLLAAAGVSGDPVLVAHLAELLTGAFREAGRSAANRPDTAARLLDALELLVRGVVDRLTGGYAAGARH